MVDVHCDISFHVRANWEITSVLVSPQAMELFSHSTSSIPIIFLITDGSVEDERHICDVMTSHLTDAESIHPRIYTFGIGNGFAL